MKPETWEQIKNRLYENLKNMKNCEEDGTYHEMKIENDMMEWFCTADGKGTSFTEWNLQCLEKIEANEK